MHRFRFAVDVKAPLPGRSWADTAREFEGLGYSTLFVPDHFDEGLGPIAAMAVAAAATTTLKVGPLVLDCDYRHPAVVGRELATIDLLSEGRLEVGVGAGWKARDYETTGIAMDRAGVRVDRMIEHVTILKAMFTGEAITFAGEHYAIDGLVGDPLPFRPGGPPFVIGGAERRMLTYAGATADIVGIVARIRSGEWDADTVIDTLPDAMDQKLEWVRTGAGERFEQLELNAWLAAVQITESPDEVVENLAALFGLVDVDPAELLQSPFTLLGTLEEMKERLQARRERWGFSYTVIPGENARELAPLVADLTDT